MNCLLCSSRGVFLRRRLHLEMTDLAVYLVQECRLFLLDFTTVHLLHLVRRPLAGKQSSGDYFSPIFMSILPTFNLHAVIVLTDIKFGRISE